MRRIVLVLCFVLSYSLVAFAQEAEKDTALGRRVYAMVEENMGFYHNPAMEQYLSALGQKLVSRLADPLFPFEFHIVDNPEPNAFAAPGGKIFVSRGLLALAITEDELACVIAHEIIHTQNRHYRNRQRSSILGGLIALPGLLVGSIFQGPVGKAVASPFIGAGALINAQYSQGDELEADRHGIGLAANAGYDPLAIVSILKRMEAEREMLTGEEEKRSYLSTHPYTPKRVKRIRQESAKLSAAAATPVVSPGVFLQQFEGLPLGPNPEYGFVQNKSLYCAQFPLQVDSLPGWDYAFTPGSVGMVSANKEAILVIEKGDDTLSSQAYLTQLEEEIRKIPRIQAGLRHDIIIDGCTGGMIEYEAAIGGRNARVQFFAIDYNHKRLEIVAAGYEDQNPVIDSLLSTLKLVKRSAIPDARQEQLKISPALSGETTTTFASRMGASPDINMICLLNEKETNQPLQEGEMLKWILGKPYSFR